MKRPTKIAVFGAGGGGVTFMSALPDSITVTAFLDNNADLHGRKLEGIPVFNPLEFDYDSVDEVYIASMWATEIRTQLEKQCGVDPSKIRIPPKHLLKREGQLPFMVPEYRKLGLTMLRAVIDQLQERGMDVYVNHGTLLGLIRDQDLIPWDDDMDIAVHKEHHIECEREHMDIMKGVGRVLRGGTLAAYMIRSSTGESVGLNVKYRPANTDGMAIVVSIAYYHIVADMAHEYLCVCPARHFRPGSFTTIAGYDPFPILADAEAFLEFRYGNWRQPDPTFSFAQHVLPDSTRGSYDEARLGILVL